MKQKTYLTSVLLALTVLMMGGCTASFSTNNGKPAAAASNTNSNSASNTAAAKKTDKPKPPTEKLKDEKKPEGEKGKQAKKIEVPKDWLFVYDEAKGYSFYVPEGSAGSSETVEGIETFVAVTPAPSEVTVYVLAYKDKKLTKEDLLDDAVKFLEGMGEKVTPGKLTAESDDYSLADASTTSAENVKSKYKILVGTDVSDNYVMIVGTEESKFAANEKIIDEIWGSFEMWSGGASGAD